MLFSTRGGDFSQTRKAALPAGSWEMARMAGLAMMDRVEGERRVMSVPRMRGDLKRALHDSNKGD